MKKYLAIFLISITIFCSCKKTTDVEVVIPNPVPLEKAIIGRWIEYESGGANIPSSMSREYHFLNDTLAVYKDNIFQPPAVCTAKYTINKGAYPETLGYFQIFGIPGQCNFSQNINLKMLSITDTTFKASYSRFTGNPPNYFEDVIVKYRKF